MAELLGLNGSNQGKTIALTRDLTRFGRGSDNDVVLADGSVSGAHCIIRKEDARYVLRDLDSSNGTRINEQDIHEQPIEHRDMLEFGNQLFRFLDPAGADEEEQKSEPEGRTRTSSTKEREENRPVRKRADPTTVERADAAPPRRTHKVKEDPKREKRTPQRKVADANLGPPASVSDQQSPLIQKNPLYTLGAIGCILVLAVSVIAYIHLVMKQ